MFVTDDEKVALIDLGMIGRLQERTQEQLLALLMAAAEGRGDDATDVLIELGEKREGFAEGAMRKDVVELVSKCQNAAALLMQVPTTFRILGYPGLAMILFMLAAGGGVMLAVQIINHDRTIRPRRRL